MKKVFMMALISIALGACDSEPKFKVEGQISDAADKMLYLEASALGGIMPLDSVKLKDKGTFSFKQARPESPEFYRLRIEDRVINFSVDSTEVVRIMAPYAEMATAYVVEGSENSSKIKELSLKQIKLQQKVQSLTQAMQSHRIGVDVFEDSLAALLKDYKDDVKVNYIFAAPNTAAAYFALFQKLNNYLIFDPLNNKDDVKCFAAVATSLNNFYPHAVRSKNLYNIVIKGMKN
ncbi:lipoprotein, partial [gut metagenome]